jgi:hypothetical protein
MPQPSRESLTCPAQTEPARRWRRSSSRRAAAPLQSVTRRETARTDQSSAAHRTGLIAPGYCARAKAAEVSWPAPNPVTGWGRRSPPPTGKRSCCGSTARRPPRRGDRPGGPVPVRDDHRPRQVHRPAAPRMAVHRLPRQQPRHRPRVQPHHAAPRPGRRRAGQAPPRWRRPPPGPHPLDLGDRAGSAVPDGISIPVDLTQEDLASMLGPLDHRPDTPLTTTAGRDTHRLPRHHHHRRRPAARDSQHLPVAGRQGTAEGLSRSPRPGVTAAGSAPGSPWTAGAALKDSNQRTPPRVKAEVSAPGHARLAAGTQDPRSPGGRERPRRGAARARSGGGYSARRPARPSTAVPSRQRGPPRWSPGLIQPCQVDQRPAQPASAVGPQLAGRDACPGPRRQVLPDPRSRRRLPGTRAWRAEEGLGSRDGNGAGDLIRTRGGKGVGHRDTAGYVLRPDGTRKRRQEGAADAIIAITRLIARHVIGHSHID